ncbi:hypothetical protein RB595_003548 [Gaeumannomyces hyphopodioides]
MVSLATKTARLRLALALALSLSSLSLPVSAQETLTDGLAVFPNCSLQCALPILRASPCSLADKHCFCDDTGLQEGLWDCILHTCSVKHWLATRRTVARVCDHATQSQNWSVGAVNMPMFALALVAVIVRLVVRSCSLRSGATANSSWSISKPSLSLLDLGDLLIVLALCGLAVTAGTGSLPLSWRGSTARVPIGVDVWTLSPELLYMFGFWLLIWELIYFVTMSLIKTSLCLLFLRIFPRHGRHSATVRISSCGPPFRLMAWATLAANVVAGVVFLVLCVVQCFPLSYTWMRWDGGSDGYCILDPGRLGRINAVFGIVMDAWMLFLPLSQIPKMNMSIGRKVGVAFMFCLGTLATVVSILRLFALSRSEATTNPSRDILGLVLLSSIEMSVGIICACLPSLRILLLCVFRGARDTVSHSRNSQSLQHRQGAQATPSRGSRHWAGGRGVEQGQRAGGSRRPMSAVHYSISSSGLTASTRPVSLPATWRGDIISEITSGAGPSRASGGNRGERGLLAARFSADDVEPAVIGPAWPHVVMKKVIRNGKGDVEYRGAAGASGA